jgi:hypothetical protein
MNGKKEDHDAFYYWVDYSLEVEFKDELMRYSLRIDGVDNYSISGKVNLAPSIEACAPCSV